MVDNIDRWPNYECIYAIKSVRSEIDGTHFNPYWLLKYNELSCRT